ncbi:unnamed protein product, partial [Prorocentrum cordatum]
AHTLTAHIDGAPPRRPARAAGAAAPGRGPAARRARRGARRARTSAPRAGAPGAAETAAPRRAGCSGRPGRSSVCSRSALAAASPPRVPPASRVPPRRVPSRRGPVSARRSRRSARGARPSAPPLLRRAARSQACSVLNLFGDVPNPCATSGDINGHSSRRRRGRSSPLQRVAHRGNRKANFPACQRK